MTTSRRTTPPLAIAQKETLSRLTPKLPTLLEKPLHRLLFPRRFSSWLSVRDKIIKIFQKYFGLGLTLYALRIIISHTVNKTLTQNGDKKWKQ